jgi:predicted ArsR family transcriptional regulator
VLRVHPGVRESVLHTAKEGTNVQEAIAALSDTRRAIMLHVKHSGGATIAELAAHLGISDEGTRQHLIHLERHGWITRRDAKDSTGRSGRPASVYMISETGEYLFPKRYDELAVALVDTVLGLYGPDAIEAALARITDAKVAEWEVRLRGKSLDERIEALKSYYADGDEFTSVRRNGAASIIEHNCPYLNVAMSHSALCSTTVSVLSRLLGCEVHRRRKFQRGDGCCEFEVRSDRPVDGSRFHFAFEPGDPPADEDSRP